MKTTADSHRRVVLPGAVPGEIFHVREEGEGRYLLVRLHRPEPKHARPL